MLGARMVIRPVILLSLALIPTVVLAQSRGSSASSSSSKGSASASSGQAHSSSHANSGAQARSNSAGAPRATVTPNRAPGQAPYGYRHGGSVTAPMGWQNGVSVPPTGFGNVNHPGGVLPSNGAAGVPSIRPFTPSIQPLPTNTQPLLNGSAPVNGGFRDGHRRHFNNFNNGVVVVGVPIAVPVYVDGYNGSTVGNGYDTTMPANAAAPDVVVIQPSDPAQQTQDTWGGPSRFVPQDQTQANATQPGPGTQSGDPPLTLLVFKNHSIYAVIDYWKDGDRLYYATSYGGTNSVELDQLDVDFTKKLNAERNIPFVLKDLKNQ